jgi:acetyltransferase EpsM
MIKSRLLAREGSSLCADGCDGWGYHARIGGSSSTRCFSGGGGLSKIGSMRGLIVVGGGDHARVVIEAARSQSWNILGIADPLPCEETVARLDVPRLGGNEVLGNHEFSDAKLVLGVGFIGVSPLRRSIVEQIVIDAKRWATIIHATAWVSPTASVARGAVILAGAVVNSGARIGAHAIINTAAVIEHDVILGDFVHIGPAAALGGGAFIGEESYLGLGARVRDHCELGRRCLVGMGAVVTRSFPDEARVVGMPAREMMSGGAAAPAS